MQCKEIQISFLLQPKARNCSLSHVQQGRLKMRDWNYPHHRKCWDEKCRTIFVAGDLSRLPILLLSSLEVYVSVGRFNEAGEKRTV